MLSATCPCLRPPHARADYSEQAVGIDHTAGRFGEVSIRRCKRCARPWLHYFGEYEAFTASGRYFLGEISEEMAETVTPESAPAILASLQSYWRFGSYFGDRQGLSSGPPELS